MKKTLILVLAAIMAIMSTVAFAATPSKTTTDLTSVLTITDAEGNELSGWALEPVEDVPEVVAQIEELVSFVQEGNAPVAFFPEEVQQQISQVIENTELVELNDIVTIDVIGDYQADEAGEVHISFSFATVYAKEQKIVPVIQIFTGELDADGNPVIMYFVLEGIVEEDGTVTIVFTPEVLDAIHAASASSLAVFCESAN